MTQKKTHLDLEDPRHIRDVRKELHDSFHDAHKKIDLKNSTEAIDSSIDVTRDKSTQKQLYDALKDGRQKAKDIQWKFFLKEDNAHDYDEKGNTIYGTAVDNDGNPIPAGEASVFLQAKGSSDIIKVGDKECTMDVRDGGRFFFRDLPENTPVRVQGFSDTYGVANVAQPDWYAKDKSLTPRGKPIEVQLKFIGGKQLKVHVQEPHGTGDIIEVSHEFPIQLLVTGASPAMHWELLVTRVGTKYTDEEKSKVGPLHVRLSMDGKDHNVVLHEFGKSVVAIPDSQLRDALIDCKVARSGAPHNERLQFTIIASDGSAKDPKQFTVELHPETHIHVQGAPAESKEEHAVEHHDVQLGLEVRPSNGALERPANDLTLSRVLNNPLVSNPVLSFDVHLAGTPPLHEGKHIALQYQYVIQLVAGYGHSGWRQPIDNNVMAQLGLIMEVEEEGTRKTVHRRRIAHSQDEWYVIEKNVPISKDDIIDSRNTVHFRFGAEKSLGSNSVFDVLSQHAPVSDLEIRVSVNVLDAKTKKPLDTIARRGMYILHNPKQPAAVSEPVKKLQNALWQEQLPAEWIAAQDSIEKLRAVRDALRRIQ